MPIMQDLHLVPITSDISMTSSFFLCIQKTCALLSGVRNQSVEEKGSVTYDVSYIYNYRLL
jgi:hypothetical protein